MKIKLATGNRISLPSELRKQANLVSGQVFEISYDRVNNRLIIDLNNVEETEETEEIIEVENTTKLPTTKHTSTLSNKLVPNFQQTKKLTKSYYSNCGLIVKTKRKYINNICERCKGQLIKEYTCNGFCNYVNENNKETNKIVEQLTENVEKLKHKLDLEIENITSTTTSTTTSMDCNSVYKMSHKILEPIQNNDSMVCTCCNNTYTQGFLIDETFYCKECAKNDFLEFLTQYRELRNQFKLINNKEGKINV